MAFIAINARADVEGSKKGKLTPAQNAQLNAWCLSSKTGIFDCLGKCEYNSTTTSLVPLNNKVTIRFKKGYVVICGRLIECEDDTTIDITTPTNGEIKGKIILRYNLNATGNKEFEFTTTTNELTQVDLNENVVSGVYEFELYSYVATSSWVELTRTQPYIPDLNGRLEQFEQGLRGAGKPLNGYDDSKGTIEERLSALGFNRGVFVSSASTGTPTIYSLGKWGVVKFDAQYDYTSGANLRLNINENNNTERTLGTTTSSIVSKLNSDIVLKTFTDNFGSASANFQTILTKTGRLYIKRTSGNLTNVSISGASLVVPFSVDENFPVY